MKWFAVPCPLTTTRYLYITTTLPLSYPSPVPLAICDFETVVAPENRHVRKLFVLIFCALWGFVVICFSSGTDTFLTYNYTSKKVAEV